MDGWSSPRPFIQSSEGRLTVDEETANLLANVRLPVVSVAIAGIYRTGKSYLMNRLAGKQSGFPLGDTLQSKTKGIWVWYLPHPNQPGHALLLLDTEGLSDPEKASETDDIQLLCLAVLLSSFFVYNAIGKIDQEMINRLYFLAEVLDSISIKERQVDEKSTSTYEELHQFLPDFSLVVRDFSLELKVDNNLVTPNEYFSKILQLKDDTNDKYNRPREAIQHAFRSHHCFVFSRPVEDDELFRKLESLKENELSSTFVQQSMEFCEFVHSNANPKKVNASDGHAINGQVWLSLAREYILALNSGAVPSIESTFTSVADRANEEAVSDGVRIYNEEMTKLTYPLTVGELQSAHQQASNQAINRFQQQTVADKGEKYLTILKGRLSEALANYTTQNEQTSRTKCRQLLDTIFNGLILPKLQQSTYVSCRSGNEMYEADLQALQSNYTNQPNKGCMDATVLQEFVNERAGERANIRNAVEQLIIREQQQLEAERQREAAELAAKMEQIRLEEERQRNEEIQRQQEEERLRLEEEQKRQLEEHRKRMEEEMQKRLRIEAELLQLENELKRLPLMRWFPNMISEIVEKRRQDLMSN